MGTLTPTETDYQEYGGQHDYGFVVLPAKHAYYDC